MFIQKCDKLFTLLLYEPTKILQGVSFGKQGHVKTTTNTLPEIHSVLLLIYANNFSKNAVKTKKSTN